MGEENALTLNEIIAKEEEEFQEAAIEFPGRTDWCSYNAECASQRVFVCMTCTGAKNIPAGVCYGCSVSCHATHDLVPLDYKREFRCDCGNACFPEDIKCTLIKEKTPHNEENRYNHNYVGLFCICNKPYEPEHTMIKCALCQDWFHEKCLGVAGSPGGLETDEDEYICGACSVRNFDWLGRYATGAVRAVRAMPAREFQPSPEDSVNPPDITTATTTANELTTEPSNAAPSTLVAVADDTITSAAVAPPSLLGKRKAEDELGDDRIKRPKFENPIAECAGACLIAGVEPVDPERVRVAGMFCFATWRKALCRCDACNALYRKWFLDDFLFVEGDDEDSVEEEEEEPVGTPLQASMNAFTRTVPADVAATVATGVNDGIQRFKMALQAYLRTRTTTGPVTAEEMQLVIKLADWRR